MKAITLHQPWASLVALGVKTIETRSWPCPSSLIGQPLAIHAGAKAPRDETVGDWLALSEVCGPGKAWMIEAHVPIDRAQQYDIPLGAVVATCRVAACVPMVDRWPAPLGRHETPRPPCLYAGPDYRLTLWPYSDEGSDEGCRGQEIEDQRPYGDFRPGRYAWLLEDVKPTTERCPACWDRPPEVMAGVCVDIDGGWWHTPGSCRYCANACPVCVGGTRRVDPVPARGRQRVWNWEA